MHCVLLATGSLSTQPLTTPHPGMENVAGDINKLNGVIANAGLPKPAKNAAVGFIYVGNGPMHWPGKKRCVHSHE